jgi:hypothetical protein
MKHGGIGGTGWTSKRFTYQKLVRYQLADCTGIDNTPPLSLIPRLEEVAHMLDVAFILLGYRPIDVLAGYLCPILNAMKGGAVESPHTQGYAAAFVCDEFGTPREVAKALCRSEFKFDQLTLEGVSKFKPDGAWVSVSIDPRMRREVRTTKYGRLKNTYAEGLQ